MAAQALGNSKRDRNGRRVAGPVLPRFYPDSSAPVEAPAFYPGSDAVPPVPQAGDGSYTAPGKITFYGDPGPQPDILTISSPYDKALARRRRGEWVPGDTQILGASMWQPLPFEAAAPMEAAFPGGVPLGESVSRATRGMPLGATPPGYDEAPPGFRGLGRDEYTMRMLRSPYSIEALTKTTPEGPPLLLPADKEFPAVVPDAAFGGPAALPDGVGYVRVRRQPISIPRRLLNSRDIKAAGGEEVVRGYGADDLVPLPGFDTGDMFFAGGNLFPSAEAATQYLQDQARQRAQAILDADPEYQLGRYQADSQERIATGKLLQQQQAAEAEALAAQRKAAAAEAMSRIDSAVAAITPVDELSPPVDTMDRAFEIYFNGAEVPLEQKAAYENVSASLAEGLGALAGASPVSFMVMTARLTPKQRQYLASDPVFLTALDSVMDFQGEEQVLDYVGGLLGLATATDAPGSPIQEPLRGDPASQAPATPAAQPAPLGDTGAVPVTVPPGPQAAQPAPRQNVPLGLPGPLGGGDDPALVEIVERAPVVRAYRDAEPYVKALGTMAQRKLAPSLDRIANDLGAVATDARKRVDNITTAAGLKAWQSLPPSAQRSLLNAAIDASLLTRDYLDEVRRQQALSRARYEKAREARAKRRQATDKKAKG